jgi:hypothetical protein
VNVMKRVYVQRCTPPYPHRSISPDESAKSGLRIHRTRKSLSRRPVPGFDGLDGVFKRPFQNPPADGTEREAERPSLEVLAVANTQASFAFAAAVNAAAFFRTNSCTLCGRCPVSVSTSSDIRS